MIRARAIDEQAVLTRGFRLAHGDEALAAALLCALEHKGEAADVLYAVVSALTDQIGGAEAA